MATQNRTATPAPTPVSLRPSGFAAGGGLVDDADLTIVKARFGTGYGGTGSGSDAITLQLVMKDSDDTEYQQYYSVGNGFVPAETGDEETDGTFLVPVGEKTAPSGSSNFALFLNSLINAGLPEDLLDTGYINALEGLVAHYNRVPAPKRGGLPAREGANAGREQTILLCTSVVTLPGEAAPAKGKTAPKKGAVAAKAAPAKAAAGKAAPAKAAAAAPADDLNDEIAGVLMGAFVENGIESAPKVKLVQMLFKAVDKTDPNRQAMMSAVGKEETLMALPGFEFDGSVLKLA